MLSRSVGGPVGQQVGHLDTVHLVAVANGNGAHSHDGRRVGEDAVVPRGPSTSTEDLRLFNFPGHCCIEAPRGFRSLVCTAEQSAFYTKGDSGRTARVLLAPAHAPEALRHSNMPNVRQSMNFEL